MKAPKLELGSKLYLKSQKAFGISNLAQSGLKPQSKHFKSNFNF